MASYFNLDRKHVHKNTTLYFSKCCVKFLILAAIHCGHLIAPSHGSKQGSDDVVDYVVLFSCDPSYRLQGSERRTCTMQGTWDGVKAECVG